ncbi:diguanylate cyclase domain-containing protein [Thiohalorhabdus methylotrophus]|uniref:diguanylate cyclase n=1 Tax=Thiohalorhabdus methylotrophus TaxID=3242694 RepID=A0ABV4TWS8_9GAMM
MAANDRGSRERTERSAEELQKALREQEQDSASVRNDLEQALARIALLAFDQDSRLDALLTELRTAIRNKQPAERIAELARSVDSAIRELDQPAEPGEAITSPGEALLQLLAKLHLPRHLTPDLDDLRGRLRRAPSATLPAERIDELARLLEEAGGAAEPRRGLRNLLGGTGPSPGRPLRVLLDELILPEPLQEAQGRLSEQLADGREETAARAAEEIARLLNDHLTDAPPPSKALRRPLTRLVEALGVEDGDTEEIVQELQTRITDGPRAGDLPGILTDAADLSARVRDRFEEERADLEAFLQHLLQNLVDLEERFQSAAMLRSTARQHSDDLRAQMEGLESEIMDSEELESLKRVVRSRLEAVRERIEAHQHAEEERDHQLESEIDTLRARLAEVEQESQFLRKRLQAEHRRAQTDPLTGLLNRLGYEEEARRVLAQHQAEGGSLSMAVLDVDRFKELNDRFGHQVGDKALRTIGALLGDLLPNAECTLARYGGEEFVVVLPGLDSERAMAAVDRMRARLAEASFTAQGERFRITLSAGVAELAPQEPLKSAFQRADHALLAAKEGGRDAVYPAATPE